MHDAHLEPFLHLLFEVMPMWVFNLEFFDKNRFTSFDFDLVHDGIRATHIVFVKTEDPMVPEQQGQLFLFNVLRHI